jgi:menaquinone-specific isochorismate synthase
MPDAIEAALRENLDAIEATCVSATQQDRELLLVVDLPGGALGGRDALASLPTAAQFRTPAGTHLVAVGAASEVSAATASLPAAESRFRDAIAGIVRAEAARGAGRPVRWLGGVAFPTRTADGWEGWPALRFVAPVACEGVDAAGSFAQLVVCARPGDAASDAVVRALRSVDAGPAPGQAPAPSTHDYPRAVSRVLEAIEAGTVDKVVVARSERVALERPVDIAALTAELGASNPDAWVFAMPGAGGVFVGASPELLLRSRGRAVESFALAGTRRRDLTGRLEDDVRALRASTKDAAEHRWVAAAVVDALEAHGAVDAAGEEPDVLVLPGVLHLLTRYRAALDRDASALALAGALHPTPAVAGTPRDAALALIDALESTPRGWYCGAVGTVDEALDVELAVALRSAFIDDAGAVLFAGAGIVSGSQPARELAETDAKMGAMRRALARAAAPLGAFSARAEVARTA